MKTKPLIIITVLVTIAAAGGGGYYFFQKRQRALKTERTEIAPERRDIIQSIQATGIVEPENKVDILPPIAGRIDEIKVNEGEQVKQGQVIAIMSSTNRAALLDIAKSKSKEERKSLEETYLPTPVFSPVNGLIINKAIVPGQTVTQQTVLFQLSDHLIVRAQVDETDLGRIALGMQAEMTVDAFPGQTLKGVLARIAQSSKTVNNVNVYSVDINLNETSVNLRSGMTANVNFILNKRENVLTIPVWAVNQRHGNQATVYIAGNTQKELTLGISDGKFVEISGIDDGTSIFVEPFKLNERHDAGGSPFTPFSGQRKGPKK